jgi:hypothetical protein
MNKKNDELECLLVKKAAPRIGKSPVAIRHALRRGTPRRDGDRLVVDLGEGIFAFKKGRVWRICFRRTIAPAGIDPSSTTSPEAS